MSKAPAKTELDRALALDIVRVTEATAVAAALWRGRGNEAAADEAAADRHVSRACPPADRGRGGGRRGRGERDPAALYRRDGRRRRADPRSRSISPSIRSRARRSAPRRFPMRCRCWRVAERGSLLKVPTIYMDKIAIGPGFPEGLVDLDASPADNLKALAAAKGVPLERDHRLHPRSPAPRQADRGGARDRRRRCV